MTQSALPDASPTEPFAAELATAQAAALAAGQVLLDCRSDALDVQVKQDGTLVTKADLAAETEVLRILRAEFPEDRILAEEAGRTEGASSREWIVDPLDGTTNFSRGLPFFAVSIALWEHEEPAVGVVYLPVLDELFAATREGAATLNGEQIRVSRTASVQEAMINVYFDRHHLLEPGLDLLRRVALRCEGRVKNMGSTASMLCYVACGRLDAFVRNTTKKWDFAAGTLVLERAGGSVSDFEGNGLRESGQSLLATNRRLHPELAGIVSVMSQHFGEH